MSSAETLAIHRVASPASVRACVHVYAGARSACVVPHPTVGYCSGGEQHAARVAVDVAEPPHVIPRAIRRVERPSTPAVEVRAVAEGREHGEGDAAKLPEQQPRHPTAAPAEAALAESTAPARLSAMQRLSAKDCSAGVHACRLARDGVALEEPWGGGPRSRLARLRWLFGARTSLGVHGRREPAQPAASPPSSLAGPASPGVGVQDSSRTRRSRPAQHEQWRLEQPQHHQRRDVPRREVVVVDACRLHLTCGRHRESL
eukprot:7389110-Prymnesium_polylepis.1